MKTPPELPKEEQLTMRQQATVGCRDFIAKLATAARQSGIHEKLPDFIHALDHVERLLARCHDVDRIRHLAGLEAAAEDIARLEDACHRFATFLRHPGATPDPAEQLEAIARELEEDHHKVRRKLITASAKAARHPADLDKDLDALRWLRRCAWHVSRLSHYLGRAA